MVPSKAVAAVSQSQECPSLPGCVSQGATEAAAIENVREAIKGCVAARKANNLPLAVEVREVEVEVA